MGRAFLYILLAIVLISLLRGVIGILGKAFTSLGEPPANAQARGSPAEPRQGGELKRDPVCGTYVAEHASVKRTIRGEVVHFCSSACSDKYAGQAHGRG